MAKSQNKEAYNKIFAKLKEHHKWFENSIPLIASENVPSPMGAFLSAFKKKEDALALKNDKGGEIYSWTELINHLN